MAELRIQIPGGSLTVQDLRELVGWAGSTGAESYRFGDAQDLILEAPVHSPGPPPTRVRLAPRGSIQSSAFAEAPTAALPWLTTGVWMDLLAELPDPGSLDVQVIHEPVVGLFLRHGHLRLVARKAAHQWALQLRRPGGDRLLAGGVVSTGDLPQWVARARAAWDTGDESFWRGTPGEPGSPGPLVGPGAPEGFHRETSTGFCFGFEPPSGRISVPLLRDMAWLASDSGASRVWLTPGRGLVFDGLAVAKKPDWWALLAAHRLPERHGDLARSVQAAGSSREAMEARAEVVAFLSRTDRMAPSRRLLVADQRLNLDDGVSAQPFPLVIRTTTSWLFRSGDGGDSGEGALQDVLDALDRPRGASTAPGLSPVIASDARPEAPPPRCPDCLTVYDLRWGDPLGGIAVGVPFADLPEDWCCPVCGLPSHSWIEV